MIPSGFIFLERMPLTAHGKIDRPRAGGDPRGSSRSRPTTFVAPRNSTEEVLADIWAESARSRACRRLRQLLRLGRSFASWRARYWLGSPIAFGVSLPLRALFEAPTIAALARRIDEARETHIERADSRNRARERRRPPASVHCAGARAEDRARTPRAATIQPAFRLSAAGAAERSRARAKPGRSRAPARLAAHEICLGKSSSRSLSSYRPPISIHLSSSKILQTVRSRKRPRQATPAQEGGAGSRA